MSHASDTAFPLVSPAAETTGAPRASSKRRDRPPVWIDSQRNSVQYPVVPARSTRCVITPSRLCWCWGGISAAPLPASRSWNNAASDELRAVGQNENIVNLF